MLQKPLYVASTDFCSGAHHFFSTPGVLIMVVNKQSLSGKRVMVFAMFKFLLVVQVKGCKKYYKYIYNIFKKYTFIDKISYNIKKNHEKKIYIFSYF